MSSIRLPRRFQGPLLTRRHLQVALGLLWLFDGILQAQAPHFTANFFGSMLRMGMAEPPGWLWDLGSRVEPLLTTHPAVANAIFTALEIAIGAALLWRRTARVALAASIPFAVGIWLFGEAAGGLFGPGASALTGAPGAALVYAAVAVLVWPRKGDRAHGLRPSEPSSPNEAAATEELGGPLLDLIWVALWLGTAALESETLNRLPIAAGSAIYNAGNGEPGWLVAMNHSVGNLVGAQGVLFAACAGVVQGAIGLGILARRTRTLALVAGIAVALFYGVVGQDLGGIFSNGLFGVLGSGATDPGSGPVVALLALCLWAPKRSSGSLAANAWAPLHAEERDAAA